MDFKIDKDGVLQIKRNGEYKKQRCKDKNDRCGDMCPLFSEPFNPKMINQFDESVPNRNFISIKLCESRILICTTSDFKDER